MFEGLPPKTIRKSGCFECPVVALSPSFVLPNNMVCIPRCLTYNRCPFGGQSMSRRLAKDFYKPFLLQLEVLKCFLCFRAEHILCSHHGECCTHVRYYTHTYLYNFLSNSCSIILLKVLRCKCRWKHRSYLLPPTYVPY